MDIVSDGKSDMILVPTQSANTVRFLHFALIDNLFLFTLCFEVKSEREVKSPPKKYKKKGEKPFTLFVYDLCWEKQSMVQGLLSLHPPTISTLSGTWKRRAGPPPLCLLFFPPLYVSPEKCNSLDAIPRFHLPQAKRADTMKVHSKKLIKSSCPL